MITVHSMALSGSSTLNDTRRMALMAKVTVDGRSDPQWTTLTLTYINWSPSGRARIFNPFFYEFPMIDPVDIPTTSDLWIQTQEQRYKHMRAALVRAINNLDKPEFYVVDFLESLGSLVECYRSGQL